MSGATRPAHALLSPSAAHRWLHCAAAPWREHAMRQRKSSKAADEGTLAHALCARSVKKEILGHPIDQEQATISRLLDLWIPEMDRAAANYTRELMARLETARATDPTARLMIETQVDLEAYIPGGFGTVDAAIVTGTSLEVIDFKFGKGIQVDARQNPQLMIYALGMLANYGGAQRPEQVRLTIYQPRRCGWDSWIIPTEELYAWGSAVLIKRSAAAWRGMGDRGEPSQWCRFCGAKALCPELAEEALRLCVEDGNLLSADRMARQVLPALPRIKGWVEAVESHALAEAMAGTRYPGFKLVRGAQRRTITDKAGMVKALRAMGYADNIVLKDPEPVNLSVLATVVGRQMLNEELSPFIGTTGGKPVLVAASDRRPAIDAATEFASIEI